ncbi:MAG: uracil-DNA glycosylase [Bdellovibrionaceae bacterium]|jgi:uracil-DNA glycosylase|nr:uracil-DNA glycosylase [Pseudobdellovibrionaceae bacterium]
MELEKSWNKVIGDEFSKDYLLKLNKFLESEKIKKKEIFPQEEDRFSAFNSTPFKNTRVVIIGQDPYHGEGQAHGLCFSVKPGVKTPPSLVNIYKELKNDLDIDQPQHGYLQSWANQGVLLLNTVLSVEKAKAGSHQKKGWEQFTGKVIETLNEKKENLVFILWGAPAQKKGEKIDENKHLVLRSAHPSPLSAYRGFYNNHHFSKTNCYLEKHDKKPIDWQLSEI